jgi:hypothetical protein
MNAPRINGYVLVSMSPGLYRGVDRDPWDYIDERYYAGTLPDSIRTAYDVQRKNASHDLWWLTCNDLPQAMTLADFSRQQGMSVELIAIHSPYLAQVREQDSWEEPRARSLGSDVVSIGEWSLLRAGLEEAPDSVAGELATLVNSAGLLRDPTHASTIEQRYRELAEANIVEPIADAASGLIESVAVYSMNG